MIKYKDIYLVDCENVGMWHLDIEPTSLAYYFTSNTNKLSRLGKNERQVHINHNNEKNALDFVIDSELGFLARHYGNRVAYHIVSRDSGFNVVADYWTGKGYKCERISSLVVPHDVNDRLSFVVELSPKNKKKICNIYRHWLRGRHPNFGGLYNLLVNAYSGTLIKREIMDLTEELYKLYDTGESDMQYLIDWEVV